jgi:LysM repeat protein
MHTDMDTNPDRDDIIVPPRRDKMPLVVIGIGLLLLLSLFFKSLFTTQSAVDPEALKALDERVKQMELKFDAAEATLSEMEKRSKAFAGRMAERIDRLEATSHALSEAISENRAVSTAKGSDAGPERPEVSRPSGAEVHHEIKPGETLFSISQRYGLSVEELRKLNNLAPDAVIRPGQQLKISEAH